MFQIPQDLRLSFRQLARRPGLTLLVVSTIGIGIAVATTAFSLVNAAFLRPPAVEDGAGLVNVYMTRLDAPEHQALSYPDYLDLRDATGGVFSDTFGYSGLLTTWSEGGRAESLFGELVTGSYFPTLGIRPAAGRLLTSDDDRVPGGHPVVVVGHAFWQRRLGGDPDVVGRALMLNGRPYTVVGVAPPEFTGLLFRGFSVDVWAPTMMMGQLRVDQLANREERWMFTRARLAPGVDASSAGAAVAAVGSRLAAAFPSTNEDCTFAVVPSSRVWISPDADRPLALLATLLVGACLLALAVCLLNVLSLLTARLVGRSRELALQTALGATTWRIRGQLMVEALLMAGGGGVLAVALTSLATGFISSYRPPLPIPLAFNVTLDGRVLLFAGGLTVAAALLVALAQARHLARQQTARSLGAGLASFEAGRTRRHWLLAPQVAGSVVLLVLAALLTRSVSQASRVELGFDPAGTGMLTYTPGTSGLDEADARRFLEQLAEAARADPRVSAVSLTDRIPLDLYGSRTVSVVIDDDAPVSVQAAGVTADYFRTFGIPVRSGRVFSPGDLTGGPAAAVVNEAFAERYLSPAAATGRVVTVGGRALTVIGVVGTAKVQTLAESPTPVVYLPLVDRYASVVRLAIRSDTAVGPVLDEVVREATRLRPEVALVERRTMAQHSSLMLLPFELGASAAALLGTLAVLLAAAGLHGLVALTVASRTREFGVRLALGATPGRLVRTAAAETARAAATGLVVGLVAAAVGAKGLEAFVFGVGAWDPVSYASVAVLLVAVAGVATLTPLWRVSRTDPVRALRSD